MRSSLVVCTVPVAITLSLEQALAAYILAWWNATLCQTKISSTSFWLALIESFITQRTRSLPSKWPARSRRAAFWLPLTTERCAAGRAASSTRSTCSSCRWGRTIRDVKRRVKKSTTICQTLRRPSSTLSTNSTCLKTRTMMKNQILNNLGIFTA